MEGKQAECQSPKTSDHLRFQATEMISGVVAAPFPSFQRRGGRAAAGVVSKGREAHLICWNLLTVINPSPYRARASRSVCAAKERNLFIEAQLGQEKKVALSRNAICTAVRISKPRRGKTTEEKQPIKPAKPPSWWRSSKAGHRRQCTTCRGNRLPQVVR